MDMHFYLPTEIVMEDGCVLRNKDKFKLLGKKALIVTGRNSARICGGLDDVVCVLSKNAQKYAIYDKVMSNPTIECVYDGAQFARETGADFVIAIGGGSPMDAAKAIALLAVQDISREDLLKGNYTGEILPTAFIPTTAGTGSEVTQYSILTDNEARTKVNISSRALFPTLALLDGKYTAALSRDVAVNTAVDALTHGIESYLSLRSNKLTSTLALESISIISRCFEKLKNFTLSRGDRNQLLYASTLGGIVIAHTGTIAVHAMGYPLTYYKDIDHGRANGLLIGKYLRFVLRHEPDKIRDILIAMHLGSIDEFEVRLDGLLGEKESLTRDEIKKFCDISINTRNVSNTANPPGYEDLLEMYASALGGGIYQ